MGALGETTVVLVGAPLAVWWVRGAFLPALIGLSRVLRAGLGGDPGWRDVARGLRGPLLANAAVAVVVAPVGVLAPDLVHRITSGPGFGLAGAAVFIAAVFLLMDDATWASPAATAEPESARLPLPRLASNGAAPGSRRRPPRRGLPRRRADDIGPAAQRRSRLRLVLGGRGAGEPS